MIVKFLEISKDIILVVSCIICIPAVGLALHVQMAQKQLRCEIREAKSRKIIKSTSPRKFRTFMSFNLLPKELQLAIWRLALQDFGPRTVKLKLFWWEYKVPTSRYRDYLGSIITARQEYNARIPALLHACQDSREVALEKYKLSFAKLLQDRPVYFDIDKDTLWVTGGRRQNFCFPIRLIGMDGFRNLIITPSRGFIAYHSAITSFEPHSTWFSEFSHGTKGQKKYVQIVLGERGRKYHHRLNTDAQLLYDGFNEIFNKWPARSEHIYRHYPSITVVRRHDIDFGGGHW